MGGALTHMITHLDWPVQIHVGNVLAPHLGSGGGLWNVRTKVGITGGTHTGMSSALGCWTFSISETSGGA